LSGKKEKVIRSEGNFNRGTIRFGKRQNELHSDIG